MTVIDRTAKGQTDTIVFEIDLQHAPEKVWRAITQPALLAEWLLPTIGFELAPGKEFTLKTQPYPGWDGTVACRILTIEEQRKLSYTWVVAGDLTLDTVVTFSLTPTPTGTRLSIEQSGFKPEQKQNFGGARYGWGMMGQKLVDLLAKGA